jgi:transcriptional regulator with XRE-family HTH domain
MNNLKKIREKHGYTQDYVAKKIGVSESTYSRYESEKRKLDSDTLKKIERDGYYNFDDWAEYQQPLENLDNGYVTPEYLSKVLRGYFTKKANGKYPNTTKSMFGSTQKIDFIKSKLEELVQ